MKRALLTGATGGLGLALAKILHREGFTLILTGRDPAILSEMAHKFSAQTLILDLQSDLAPLFDLIRRELPDLVINNAGFGFYGEALAHSTEAALAQVRVNATAPLAIALETARALREYKKPGVILTVSSIAGAYSFPGLAVYAASKSFITSVSKSLDAELRPFAIRVLAALPGQISTPFASRAAGKPHAPNSQSLDPSAVAEAIWRQIKRRSPLCIIDWRYRISYYLSFLLPRSWIESRLYQNILSRMYHE